MPQPLTATVDKHVLCLACLNCTTTSDLNSSLMWHWCSNCNEELLVMHENPQASPRCLESCPLLLLSCLAHNCLTPSWHGHSVGFGVCTQRGVCAKSWCSPPWCVFPYIWKDMDMVREIHQRMCVTTSYFPSTPLRFWYYALISSALLVCSLLNPFACKYTSKYRSKISYKIVFAENRKNVGFNILSPPPPATPGLVAR